MKAKHPCGKVLQVVRTDKENGKQEIIELWMAVERLRGYYRLGDAEMESLLRQGRTLQTSFASYRAEKTKEE